MVSGLTPAPLHMLELLGLSCLHRSLLLCLYDYFLDLHDVCRFCQFEFTLDSFYCTTSHVYVCRALPAGYNDIRPKHHTDISTLHHTHRHLLFMFCCGSIFLLSLLLFLILYSILVSTYFSHIPSYPTTRSIKQLPIDSIDEAQQA